MINEYLKIHPKQEQDINTLISVFGSEEAEKICAAAILGNKKIYFIIDPMKLDYLSYKLVNYKSR